MCLGRLKVPEFEKHHFKAEPGVCVSAKSVLRLFHRLIHRQELGHCERFALASQGRSAILID